MEAFIVPPPETHRKQLWKLQKRVCRFYDAVRKQNSAKFEVLKNLGSHISSIDYGVFSWYNYNHSSGISCPTLMACFAQETDNSRKTYFVHFVVNLTLEVNQLNNLNM